jgi:hypothetical protein
MNTDVKNLKSLDFKKFYLCLSVLIGGKKLFRFIPLITPETLYFVVRLILTSTGWNDTFSKKYVTCRGTALRAATCLDMNCLPQASTRPVPGLGRGQIGRLSSYVFDRFLHLSNALQSEVFPSPFGEAFVP